MNGKQTSPWAWIPSLYIAEGIPYFIVNVISVTMYKRLGLSNDAIAFYTSLLYLPWVVKCFWSPFVDIIRSKRWWIILTQAIMAVSFALLALAVPLKSFFGLTLLLFYITAFASATHDISADGFYMIALDSHRQSLFVGVRNTFYRIASWFGQGVLVVVAGILETRLEDIPRAWSHTLLITALIFAALTVWNTFFLPKPETDRKGEDLSGKEIFKGFGLSFSTFFKKKGIWLAILFMLLYRIPEAFSMKMLTPFLLDPVDAGGLGLTTADSGLIYGTVGAIALLAGGLLGGVAGARWGLRKALWPMALSLALPCAVYLYLAIAQPVEIWKVYLCVAFDQFGYGFGFTAYTLFMMYFSEGAYKTSHYALCTAFMALSMMLPGLIAGKIQMALGYRWFFVLVMVCCLATVAVTFVVRGKIDSEYGKK